MIERGVRTSRVVRAVARHSRASRATIEAFQNERLRALVSHAYERVPYYRELFDRYGIHPRHVRTTADLARIPISSREDLRACPPEQLIARDLDPAGLITTMTSGSSGEPFEMRNTWLEQNLEYLFRLRARRQLGQRAGDRIAMIARPVRHHPKDNKLLGMALRCLGLQKRSRFSLFDPPEELAAHLKAFQPDIVTGFPSVLQRIGEALVEKGAAQVRPRFLLTEAEVLTPALRARIEGDWGTRLFETYGCHEFNLLAWECPATGALHTCDDSVVIEVLKDGRPVAPGERGEVVATGLHLYAMPFIRYRLADVVTRGDTECACGQPFSTIRSIQGRMRDFFLLPGGRWLHPSTFIDGMQPDAQDWVRKFQFVQEREDRIVMRFVPMPDARAERIAAYERYLAEALGPGVEVRIERVDEIPHGPGGKYHVFRSLVRSDYDGFDWERADQARHRAAERRSGQGPTAPA